MKLLQLEHLVASPMIVLLTSWYGEGEVPEPLGEGVIVLVVAWVAESAETDVEVAGSTQQMDSGASWVTAA